MTDLKFNFGTDIIVIRSCYHADGADLLAIAGEGSVEVIQCSNTAIRPLAYFLVGVRVSSIAWSPKTVSPSASDRWILELAISTHDFGLHILSKSNDSLESIRKFGGGLTGHHARVNDITFVGGQEDIARHVATVSDDRNLIVWDLRPSVTNNLESCEDPQPSGCQPTALVIPFAHPLCSVSSHASTSKELLVSDTRGSVFLIDWRKDPSDSDKEVFSHQSILELVHPRSLSDALANTSKSLFGYASWRTDDPSIVGAVFGSEFAVWDMGKLKGGKPFAIGPAFSEGGHKFRWCPSLPEYFAISTSAMTSNGGVISVYSIHHLQAQTATIQIAPQPHRVIDFDWIGNRGTPRLAAAVGRDVFIFPISLD
ncbi:hypothetical protein ACEPAI_4961 [Sanghuangporus weigelae]